ncbi:hypothetical protein ACLKA7_014883 [Drosophila subpalustris]
MLNNFRELDLEPIPPLCDSIQCPPDAEMQCPEDSAVREISEINAVDLINSNLVPSSLSSGAASTESSAYNSSLLTDDLFVPCCLAKKCVCKTCYIPDCKSDKGEVMVELEPEAMDTPGQCCGYYECMAEPNCTEVRDTNYNWLQSCQRCLCTSGRRICEQICDESKNAICESKNLNTFFKDGEDWDDGCYHCECVKGEEKCTISLCDSLDCPSDRQVHLKGECCPTCWPKGHPMPHQKQGNYDEGYGYEREQEDGNAEVALAPVIDSNTSSSSSTSTTTSTTASSTTERPEMITKIDNNFKDSTTASTATKPCQEHDFPNVVEVVHPLNGFKDPHLYHIIIVVLVIIIGILYFYIRHLLAKQRSYRPVSNFDDKV